MLHYKLYRYIIILMPLITLFPSTVRAEQCPFSQQKLDAHQVSLISKVKAIPKSYGNSFLLGDYPAIRHDLLGFLHNLWKTYQSPIVEIDIPLNSILHRHYAILSPIIAQAILLDKSGIFTKGVVEKRAEKNIFSPEGLIWMDANKRWESLNKKLLEGPLNPKCFSDCYSAVFRENFIWFIERLSLHDKPFELYREVTYYTMRTMTQAFFNYILADECLIAITDAFAFMMNFMHARETQICSIPLSLPLQHHQAFYKHLTTFNTILKKIILEAPDSIIINDISYPTMIGIFKSHRDPKTNFALTPQEIHSHVATLFFAAHDTTANFITMLIYHLSITDIWRNKLQAELQENPHKSTYEWLPMAQLTEYTHFKNEILRLYPSVPVISINTTEDVLIDTYMIPKNSVLLIAIEQINTHPDFFKNPHTFNPHRFDKDNHDYTPFTNECMITFNFGFRRCIGQWFAQAEAQSFVHNMLMHDITFDLIDKKTPMSLTMKLTGMPSRPLWAYLKKPYRGKKTNKELTPPSIVTCTVPMKIIEIRPENENNTIKTYRLARLDNKKLPFTYRPGDHLELTITTKNKEPIMRHFSISSSPTDSDLWIEITIKNEDFGLFSPYMHHEMVCDDILIVRAPFDDGVRISHDDDPDKPLILISGGIGITPMVSITRYLMTHNWPGELYFIHSNKNQQNLAFLQELISLAQKHPNLHLIYTFTKNNDVEISGVECYHGRLDQSLFASLALKNIENARVYLCGSTSMCTDIQKILNAQYNIPHSEMHFLSFGNPQALTNSNFNRYTLSEVALHKKRSDAWIVIDSIVYDITNYLAYHPGLDILLDYIGTDATEAFTLTPHSAQAKKTLNQSSLITIKGVLDVP